MAIKSTMAAIMIVAIVVCACYGSITGAEVASAQVANDAAQSTDAPKGVPRALLATESASQWRHGQDNCWTIGTAPLCAGSCADCTNEGAECVNGNYIEGANCWIGRKVRCCKNRW